VWSYVARRAGIVSFAGLLGLAAVFGAGRESAPTEASVPTVRQLWDGQTSPTLSTRSVYVIDGDTIDVNGTRVRLADINAPEIASPKCTAEAALGRKAKRRLAELIGEGPIEVVSISGRDLDQYGRELRIVRRDGRSLGDVLVSEGLAQHWNGPRRVWCR
jgi:endonuclease YncB( thermonuclease family)